MRCIAPAGGACSTDSYCDTLAGYYCTGGECAIPTTIAPAGGACSADSNCDAAIGYSCINGRCEIDAGRVCLSGDICRSGYSCINGLCAIPVTIAPAGGACSADSNCDAAIGYSCISGRCEIDAGRVCVSGDICRSGYSCINGLCGKERRTIVPAGGVCSADSYCDTTNGYYCINRECVIDAGGVCYSQDICRSGYSCINGRCGQKRRTIVPAGGVCTANDVCDNQAGYSCIEGRCSIAANGVCHAGDYCRKGYTCTSGRCVRKPRQGNRCQGQSVSAECQEVGELAAKVITKNEVCDDKFSPSKNNYRKSCRSSSTCVCKKMISSKIQDNCPQELPRSTRTLDSLQNMCKAEVKNLTQNDELVKPTIDGELEELGGGLKPFDSEIPHAKAYVLSEE